MGTATEVTEFIATSDFWTTFSVVLGILVVFKVLGGVWDYFTEKTGITTRRHIEQKKKEERLDSHEQKIENMGVKISLLEVSVKDIEQSLIEIDKKLDQMQEKDDVSQRARIKDRIGQAYGIYHKRKQWTQMEKEAFLDLVASYEKHGGKNSFVHDTCLPESYTWEVISG